MIAQLGKDISNAQHRILDHRAFVCGEIDTFLNEFETKRNDNEVEALFKLTETVGDLKYELSERCISLGTANLDELAKEVNNCLTGVEDFLTAAQKERELSELLVQGRKQRVLRKAEFCQDIDHKVQRIEISFEEKEEEIAELYSDLQIKLNIPK